MSETGSTTEDVPVLQNLVVAISGELEAVAANIEETGSAFQNSADLDAEAMSKLQSIDRNAQVLTNLANLLRELSGSIPADIKIDERVLQQTLTLSDLHGRLRHSTDATGEPSDDIEFF